MKKSFIKLLASLPVVLILMYFMPFLGVCLVILRSFVYSNKKNSTSFILIGTAVALLVPKIIEFISTIVKFDINKISYLSDIINSDIYNINIINYCKFLITVGVIFLILSFVLNSIFAKVGSILRNYINQMQYKEAEISRKNDLEIKIRQEKARNTSYVKCLNCGSDNLLSEKFGVCKYCRGQLENKNYK